MNIVLRILLGAGLFAFGYYLGREVQRGAAIDAQLKASASNRVRGVAAER
ncbi:MAG: hypothetical protein PVH54_13055 [Gammaproteobacteria bacterium]|jgi:hypothetical protein